MAANFDLTRLMKAMSTSESDGSADPTLKKLMANKVIMNLKCTYAIVSAQLSILMKNQDSQKAIKLL
jgi:hypothetical protein